ncbi:MAG: carotenoid oxygenase family protein [Synechococcales bacterium]|nr:carotenoid oxygenase family protein [Synechococcales bacterium]
MAKTWKQSILQHGIPFPSTGLTCLEGHLPTELQGTLYQNGPGRLTRGGLRVGHWFDGDGAVLAVKIKDGQAIATYRYVETEQFLAEEKANTFLYSGYGTHAAGNWLNRFRSTKNVANTSVLPLDDRLLALWEGGLPHALDRQTLEMLGVDSLALPASGTYSAHPKRDGVTGEIFNFGVNFGQQTSLNLYRSSPNGQIKKQNRIPLCGIPLIHDFVLAGSYLIFCVSPVQLSFLPLILRQKTLSEAMTWRPELGTEIILCDRDRLEVCGRFQCEPWYQWHFGNGAEQPDGTIAFDLVRYSDFSTNEFLREVATGETQTISPCQYWRYHVDPQAKRLLDSYPILPQQCEFPVVRSQEVGQPWQQTYLLVHRPGVDASMGELFGALACLDHATGAVEIANCGEDSYPGEPIYAPDQKSPDQGWILTVVYNGQAHSSEVWVYESVNFSEPVCRLGLPQVIPPSFHGKWQSG